MWRTWTYEIRTKDAKVAKESRKDFAQQKIFGKKEEQADRSSRCFSNGGQQSLAPTWWTWMYEIRTKDAKVAKGSRKDFA